MLLNRRDYFKPFEYPWAYEAYKTQTLIHWVPSEVPMAEDVADWKHKLTVGEKNLLTQLFRFFTQADIDVAHGYNKWFIPLFKGKPEIAMMLNQFAAMEAIHIDAYSTLIETLGIPEVEYQAFVEYKQMADKHNYLKELDLDKEKDLCKLLAIYSAFTEGLQLFSSFAVLLNFSRFGLMKGMGQIVSWSIRDESLHVESMIKLYHTFKQEYAVKNLDTFIYNSLVEMVKLEEKFIDLCFEEAGDIRGLTKEEVLLYIKFLGNRRLEQLGLKPFYPEALENPFPWIDWLTTGVEHANFFEATATEYSKGSVTGNEGDIVW